MNKQESDVLRLLLSKPYSTQRDLAESSPYSLGAVNKAFRNLIQEGYLTPDGELTTRARAYAAARSPKNAIILAAGFGMRMVPINMETPKALIEVHGEPLIERMIHHLHEVGVHQIYVVVGFMKESFEYLIDEYGVELIINTDYAGKNNLHSLWRAADHLSNTYIIPCDVWCKHNPFHRTELYPWYMVTDGQKEPGSVRVNRRMELVSVPKSGMGNEIIGITYLLEEQSRLVRQRLADWSRDPAYDMAFWETALFEKDRMITAANIIPQGEAVEINTYEQLRELDENSNQLRTDAIQMIAAAMQVPLSEIVDITVLKKGMTNRSFLFSCRGKRYIMRIPGEGTDQLIDRKKEAAVYQAINGYHICDNVRYMNPDNGYKITEYLEDSRVCDPANPADLAVCMKKLREFHDMKLTVEHEFDIFGQIEFYESLWNGQKSVYRDYDKTKAQVLSLQTYIEQHAQEKCLTHIDAVPDNFLFYRGADGTIQLRLIDWEYAGMQDPHVDIAMFCIYSMYNRAQIDQLIDIYFTEGVTAATRMKIYCYIAACGLLWSNWCEYKRSLGVEFGEYSLCQYRYAKDFYRIVQEELAQKEETSHV